MFQPQIDWKFYWPIKWEKDPLSKAKREFGLIKGKRYFTVGWDHRRKDGLHYYANPVYFMYKKKEKAFGSIEECKLFCELVYVEFMRNFIYGFDPAENYKYFWFSQKEFDKYYFDEEEVPFCRLMSYLHQFEDKLEINDSKFGGIRKFTTMTDGEIPNHYDDFYLVGRGDEIGLMDSMTPFHMRTRKFTKIKIKI